jgi:hypothetical protein
VLKERGLKKLEKQRHETLSAICGERLGVEEMLQRARITGASPDVAFVDEILKRLEEIKQKTGEETNIEELESLIEDAEQQGQLRAYICPRAEIRNEGVLAIGVMEEWNVPRAVIDKLRGSLGEEVKNADKDEATARSALRAIFEEQDSWRRYTNEYEDEMRRVMWRWLFCPFIGLLVVAIAITLLWPLRFPVGLLLAGAAGSCASVMAKMPVLDVSLSAELESYVRRILSRVAVGVSASLIGCGLLGWGLISFSIQGYTFADVVNACSTSPRSSWFQVETP